MSNYLLECTTCGHQYVESETEYLCPKCSAGLQKGKPLPGVLKITYDYDSISKNHKNLSSDDDWWDFLWPLADGEGISGDVTPLRPAFGLRSALNIDSLWLKDDCGQLSGSFKDRASRLVVGRAKEVGARKIVAASTGNAASSLAAIVAEEGREAVLIVPSKTPKGKLIQMLACGATIILIDGNYDEAFDLSLELTDKFGWYNRNTAFNPYTIEGKKTAAYEIWLQLGKTAPDFVIVPVGDGAIIAGIAKGFEELEKLGWITKRPRLIAVQPAGSNAIVKAYEKNIEVPESINAKSIADSLVVNSPRNGAWALKAIKESNGIALSVTDDEITKAISFLGSETGVFAEPAAAASIAALKRLVDINEIKQDDVVVSLITGNGLKDIDSVAKTASFMKPIKPTIDEVNKYLGGNV